jgi:hypothetical protein
MNTDAARARRSSDCRGESSCSMLLSEMVCLIRGERSAKGMSRNCTKWVFRNGVPPLQLSEGGYTPFGTAGTISPDSAQLRAERTRRHFLLPGRVGVLRQR